MACRNGTPRHEGDAMSNHTTTLACAHNPSRFSLELFDLDEDGDIKLVRADEENGEDAEIWLDKYARRELLEFLNNVDDYRRKL